MLELDRRQIAKWADSYHAEHQRNTTPPGPSSTQPLTPTHFEFRFGPPRPGDADHDDPQLHRRSRSCSTSAARRSASPAGSTASTSAASAARPCSTSSTTNRASGRRLQDEQHRNPASGCNWPLYVDGRPSAGVRRDDATPLCGRLLVDDRRRRRRSALLARSARDDEAPSDRLGATCAPKIVEQHRPSSSTTSAAANFPVASRDDKCTSYCEFSTVCRIAQVRSLGKTWPPEIRRAKNDRRRLRLR